MTATALFITAAPAAVAPRRFRLVALRAAVVAAVEFAEAYAVIEIATLLTVAGFSSVLMIEALGFHLVG